VTIGAAQGQPLCFTAAVIAYEDAAAVVQLPFLR
jgi:hypothetical protein